MQNISQVNPDNPGQAEDILNTVKANIGSVPNIFSTMAQSPATLKGYLAFNQALGEGSISAALAEQIALAVAGENQCDYCASAHTLMAKGAGVDKEEASRNLNAQASDPKTAEILKFARNVVRSRGLVSSESLDQLRYSDVSEQEIVEILGYIGLNLFTNYFNHVANTEIDFPHVRTAANQDAA